MGDVVWRCDVCHEMRDDRYISVFTTDTSEAHLLPPGTMSQNVKYCNDKQSCREGARRVKFI